MPDNNWVSIGEYPNFESADVIAGRLSVDGVLNRVVSADPAGPLFGAVGEFAVLVPSESLEAAQRILAESPIPDEDLTALALKHPPPDDFDPSGTRAGDEDEVPKAPNESQD